MNFLDKMINDLKGSKELNQNADKPVGLSAVGTIGYNGQGVNVSDLQAAQDREAVNNFMKSKQYVQDLHMLRNVPMNQDDKRNVMSRIAGYETQVDPGLAAKWQADMANFK